MNTLYYDNIVNGGGVAHTLVCYNYAYKLAKKFDCKLWFPPIRCGHMLGDSTRQFEQFFGIDPGSKSDDFEKTVIIEKDYVDNLSNYINSDNICFSIQRNLTSNPPDEDFSNSLEYFKTCYNAEKKDKEINLHQIDGCINIAVHIRRGDIINGKNILHERIVEDDWFYRISSNVIESLNHIFPERDVALHIYTESCNGQYVNENREIVDIVNKFSPLCDNVVLHMDGCPYESFHNLTKHDIMIGGRSGFSACSALFSSNFKLLYFYATGRPYLGTTNYELVDHHTTKMFITKTMEKVYTHDTRS